MKRIWRWLKEFLKKELGEINEKEFLRRMVLSLTFENPWIIFPDEKFSLENKE